MIDDHDDMMRMIIMIMIDDDHDDHDDQDVGKDAENFSPAGLTIIMLIVTMMNFSPLGQLARWLMNDDD